MLVGITRECVNAVVASVCECVHLGVLTADRCTQVLPQVRASVRSRGALNA